MARLVYNWHRWDCSTCRGRYDDSKQETLLRNIKPAGTYIKASAIVTVHTISQLMKTMLRFVRGLRYKKTGDMWDSELTDLAVAVFYSEKYNREDNET